MADGFDFSDFPEDQLQVALIQNTGPVLMTVPVSGNHRALTVHTIGRDTPRVPIGSLAELRLSGERIGSRPL
ncbi:MAG: hypothetical protein KC561_19485, partial [Myxococcales bacterium]|nr:hypothetical protein [Myxococcales bacterium]